jgi:integrase
VVLDVEDEACFQGLQASKVSARTIGFSRTVLRAALNQAKRWGLVVENAAAMVDPPRHVSKPIQPLMLEQARALLEAAKGDVLEPVVSIGAAIGLRIGEVMGLSRTDVDLADGTVVVRKAMEPQRRRHRSPQVCEKSATRLSESMRRHRFEAPNEKPY